MFTVGEDRCHVADMLSAVVSRQVKRFGSIASAIDWYQSDEGNMVKSTLNSVSLAWETVSDVAIYDRTREIGSIGLDL